MSGQSQWVILSENSFSIHGYSSLHNNWYTYICIINWCIMSMLKTYKTFLEINTGSLSKYYNIQRPFTQTLAPYGLLTPFPSSISLLMTMSCQIVLDSVSCEGRPKDGTIKQVPFHAERTSLLKQQLQMKTKNPCRELKMVKSH